MELTGIISLAAILIALFALMRQMNSQSNRVRDELLEAIRENRNAIQENREAIRENRDAILANREAIRENRYAIQSLDGRLSESEREQARQEGFNDTLNGRLSEAEREQARLEGANRILGDVIRQQSHTHEGD